MSETSTTESAPRRPGRPPTSAREAVREAAREPVRDSKTLKPGEFYGRDGEILSFKGDYAGDSFYIPENELPSDYEYQWVRTSVYGNGEKTYSNELPMQANGWRPVPQSRHAHTMVNQRGMVLCERPKPMNQMAHQKRERLAKEQKQDRDASHRLNTESTAFESPSKLNSVARKMQPSDIGRPSYEALPILE